MAIDSAIEMVAAEKARFARESLEQLKKAGSFIEEKAKANTGIQSLGGMMNSVKNHFLPRGGETTIDSAQEITATELEQKAARESLEQIQKVSNFIGEKAKDSAGVKYFGGMMNSVKGYFAKAQAAEEKLTVKTAEKKAESPFDIPFTPDLSMLNEEEIETNAKKASAAAVTPVKNSSKLGKHAKQSKSVKPETLASKAEIGGGLESDEEIIRDFLRNSEKAHQGDKLATTANGDNIEKIFEADRKAPVQPASNGKSYANVTPKGMSVYADQEHGVKLYATDKSIGELKERLKDIKNDGDITDADASSIAMVESTPVSESELESSLVAVQTAPKATPKAAPKAASNVMVASNTSAHKGKHHRNHRHHHGHQPLKQERLDEELAKLQNQHTNDVKKHLVARM